MEPLIAEALAERFADNESSATPDPPVQSDKSEHGSAAPDEHLLHSEEEKVDDEDGQEDAVVPDCAAAGEDVTGKRQICGSGGVENPEEEEKE